MVASTVFELSSMDYSDTSSHPNSNGNSVEDEEILLGSPDAQPIDDISPEHEKMLLGDMDIIAIDDEDEVTEQNQQRNPPPVDDDNECSILSNENEDQGELKIDEDSNQSEPNPEVMSLTVAEEASAQKSEASSSSVPDDSSPNSEEKDSDIRSFMENFRAASDTKVRPQDDDSNQTSFSQNRLIMIGMKKMFEKKYSSSKKVETVIKPCCEELQKRYDAMEKNLKMLQEQLADLDKKIPDQVKRRSLSKDVIHISDESANIKIRGPSVVVNKKQILERTWPNGSPLTNSMHNLQVARPPPYRPNSVTLPPNLRMVPVPFKRPANMPYSSPRTVQPSKSQTPVNNVDLTTPVIPQNSGSKLPDRLNIVVSFVQSEKLPPGPWVPRPEPPGLKKLFDTQREKQVSLNLRVSFSDFIVSRKVHGEIRYPVTNDDSAQMVVRLYYCVESLHDYWHPSEECTAKPNGVTKFCMQFTKDQVLQKFDRILFIAYVRSSQKKLVSDRYVFYLNPENATFEAITS